MPIIIAGGLLCACVYNVYAPDETNGSMNKIQTTTLKNTTNTQMHTDKNDGISYDKSETMCLGKWWSKWICYEYAN